MSQEQLQIFHAAFKPRLRSPKNVRQKDIDQFLRRENIKIEESKLRYHKMVRDEQFDGSNQGGTLLDQIRKANDQDKTLAQTSNNLDLKKKQEQLLKQQQNKMHDFVKDFMRSPTKKLQNASPDRIQKTGNIVLDRINDGIDQQRLQLILAESDSDVRIDSSSVAGLDASDQANGGTRQKSATQIPPDPVEDLLEKSSNGNGSELMSETLSSRSSTKSMRSPRRAIGLKERSPHIAHQRLDNLLESSKKVTKPALYQVDQFKSYRNMVGLNIVRNKEQNLQTVERSKVIQLNQEQIIGVAAFDINEDQSEEGLLRKPQSSLDGRSLSLSQDEVASMPAQHQLKQNDSLYGQSQVSMLASQRKGVQQQQQQQQPTQPDIMAVSKDYILNQGRLPENSLRKPRFKKDATCLRNKGHQYRDLTNALDLLLDGPSNQDTKILAALNSAVPNGSSLQMTQRGTARNNHNSQSMHNSYYKSPFATTANGIINETTNSPFLPGVEKQKVLNKFFEVAMMQEPIQPGSIIGNFDSSKVTAAIVNQVSKEHQLIQAQMARDRASRQSTTNQTHQRSMTQPVVSIPQVGVSRGEKSRRDQNVVVPMSRELQQEYSAFNDVGTNNESQLGYQHPLTVHVPLKVGPTKNIYQFTQLREKYKNKFIQMAQQMTQIEAEIKQVDRTSFGPPKITGAYASLINSDLHEDLHASSSVSVTGSAAHQRNHSVDQPSQGALLLHHNDSFALKNQATQQLQSQQQNSRRDNQQNLQGVTTSLHEFAINSKSQISVDVLDSKTHSYYNMQPMGTMDLENGAGQVGGLPNTSYLQPDQTGVSFQGRNQSQPQAAKLAKRKKMSKASNKYAGLNPEQIKQAKKEKRQRRAWNQYREKLQKERDAVTVQFHNNYYWNSFVPQAGRNSVQQQSKTVGAPSLNNITLTNNFGGTNNPMGGVVQTQQGNLVNLQEMVSNSCSFYENMEKKQEGSIEQMLSGLRSKIQGGKVKLDVSQHYDPQR